MLRTKHDVTALADRFCRSQRIGVFGHRGVGKTTLVTMLYREAVGGRLPELRLAAADARTAEYLSDKIRQLESGQPLPGTLAETDLRFHLYQRETRLELLLKDYQGEHVELGREEPIRAFLRDCDAVWLCLDAAAVVGSADLLRRQQEVEQLMEDYLALEPRRIMDRPVALLLTKSDLLRPERSADAAAPWTEQLSMTRHALQMHCPNSGLFTVSSLVCAENGAQKGERSPADISAALQPASQPIGAEAPAPPRPFHLQPAGLAEPLMWLAAALQTQDEARMEQLWSQAAGDPALLRRCVQCFARRYPDAPATARYRQRLRELQRQRRRRVGLAVVAGVACLILSLWTYDALGRQRASRFEAEHSDEPAAALSHWQSYRAWHPTRNLLRPVAANLEEQHLRDLERDIHQRLCAERLAELRRRAADPDGNPEEIWRQYQSFHEQFPEVSVAGDLEQLRASVKARRDEQVRLKAQLTYDELVRTEQRTANLSALVAHADAFLRDYPASDHESAVRHLRDACLLRLDERDIALARDYSAAHPLNFQTRCEHYRDYLQKHPSRGAFVREAETAVQTIEADWDKHDFRAVRDHFTAKPGDIPELVARCRTYLAVHPHGRFTSAAAELLRWSERVTVRGDYRVVLHDGAFTKNVARFFSRGPKLSVEVEVNGVRHGPSNIVYNKYDPEWNFEFPRRIQWKLGDPVHIWVTEHSWKDRVVMDVASEEGDPLAIRLLSGDVNSGPNRITFESDFGMPALPKIE
jgi:hypothetical protein